MLTHGVRVDGAVGVVGDRAAVQARKMPSTARPSDSTRTDRWCTSRSLAPTRQASMHCLGSHRRSVDCHHQDTVYAQPCITLPASTGVCTGILQSLQGAMLCTTGETALEGVLKYAFQGVVAWTDTQ